MAGGKVQSWGEFCKAEKIDDCRRAERLTTEQVSAAIRLRAIYRINAGGKDDVANLPSALSRRLPVKGFMHVNVYVPDIIPEDNEAATFRCVPNGIKGRR